MAGPISQGASNPHALMRAGRAEEAARLDADLIEKLEAAGFTDIDFQDHSTRWGGFCAERLAGFRSVREQKISTHGAEVVAALADDLNTPEALAALHAIASRMNRETNPEEAQRLRAELLAGAWLLGILNEDPETHFKGAADDLGDAAIDQLVEARNQARRNKDFARADEIRDQLHAEGIELEDTRDGTRWKRR